MKLRLTLLTAACAAAACPAAAQEPVALPAFDQVELRGGGSVVVRHGPAQRVRLLHGSREITGFAVEEGRLRIDACRSTCRDYQLEIEIVTPRIRALSIRGGGQIEAAGAFPSQASLAAAVTGGGEIDARALDARNVAAAVTGGGSILTDPEASLAASVRGGGLVRYWGNAQVTQAVSGGGAIVRASR